jgi:phosphoribosylformimino-5-aminoimidazole carboxamide ribotide isomerase
VPFTIYPAIDLRKGQVVRLQRGDPNRQTTFDDDPARAAERWVAAGAEWLHVVNLDGAFDEGSSANWNALPRLVACGAKVQFGGGLRSEEDIARALYHGVTRVVLGTAAVENPELVADLIKIFGSERIAIGIDALDGEVRTRGWQNDAGQAPEFLALQMRALGVSRIIFTDIGRDGLLSGVNSRATGDLAAATGLCVIASGGVATLDDVSDAAAEAGRGVEGLIIGRALYDGRVDLAQALDIARSVSGSEV